MIRGNYGAADMPEDIILNLFIKVLEKEYTLSQDNLPKAMTLH